EVAHTVTHNNRLFDSGLFGPGLNWSYSFKEPGLYPYHCIPHPWMKGSVDVTKLPTEEVQNILTSLGLSS
ncbi:MAG: plastocyanin/azurin family copper-binding protein, partial [Nitrososphaerota archaeon]